MGTTTQPASSPYLPVRDDWLARRTEAILEPDLPIVDPHHHLWDRPNWRYMLDDLLADTDSGHNIVATVFVQCRSMHRADGPEAMKPVGETEFVNGVAAMSASGGYGPTRVCAGIVGHADLRLGGRVREVLEAHIRAGGGRFRGIRHIAAWDADQALMNPAYAPPPKLMYDATFREGFAALAPLNLSFDAWLYHPQIDGRHRPGAGLSRHTDLPEPCRRPAGHRRLCGQAAGGVRRLAQSIRALAQCPNVVVKLGGMGMRINGFDFHEKADPPSSETLAAAWRPYIETCIEAFGAERCMFESNFPVDKGSYAYAPFWNACKILARGASEAEKTELFSGTAARFYRLEL